MPTPLEIAEALTAYYAKEAARDILTTPPDSWPVTIRGWVIPTDAIRYTDEQIALAWQRQAALPPPADKKLADVPHEAYWPLLPVEPTPEPEPVKDWRIEMRGDGVDLKIELVSPEGVSGVLSLAGPTTDGPAFSVHCDSQFLALAYSWMEARAKV